MDQQELVKSVLEKPSQFKTTVVTKPIDLALDLGNLLASDTNPVSEKQLQSKKKDEYLTSLNRDNVQILLNNIWELPTERNEDAFVATLPEPTTKIPREKPLPKPKKETKWEAYAKLKGIQNRKKDKMVWDETYQEYRPAFGFKRANDETKQWLIEVPKSADPYEDQFAKLKTAKKERIAKNELQRLRNIARNNKVPMASTALPPSEKLSKDQLNQALAVAKTSTASAGKFTKVLPQENEVKQPRGKKRKFESNTVNAATEKERQLNVLNSLNKKQTILNTNVAIKQVRKETDETNRKQNGGNKPLSKKMAKKQEAILQGKKKRRGVPSTKKRRTKK